MPITKRAVPCNFDLVDHNDFVRNKPQTSAHIFQNTHVAGMVGSIQQISLLAEYANDIFKGLQAELLETHKTMSNLTVRTTVISSQLSAVKKEILNENRNATDMIVFKRSEADIETNMLAAPTRPTAMQQHYNSQIMNRIPTVKTMDVYLTREEYETKGSCTTLYSHPNFFFFEWLKLEEAMMTQKKEEKRQRKVERQERRAKLRAEKERKSSIRQSSLYKKKGLNWRER